MGAESQAMGAADAGLGLLMDAITTAQTFVAIFIWVYTILIFVYVLTSWIRLPYSLNPVQRFLNDVCEPYLRLFRRFIPPLGALDLSPIVGIVALYALQRIINDVILDRLH
jgi:YggT family protein